MSSDPITNLDLEAPHEGSHQGEPKGVGIECFEGLNALNTYSSTIKDMVFIINVIYSIASLNFKMKS